MREPGTVIRGPKDHDETFVVGIYLLRSCSDVEPGPPERSRSRTCPNSSRVRRSWYAGRWPRSLSLIRRSSSRSPAALKRQICDVRPAGYYPLMRRFEIARSALALVSGGVRWGLLKHHTRMCCGSRLAGSAPPILSQLPGHVRDS